MQTSFHLQRVIFPCRGSLENTDKWRPLADSTRNCMSYEPNKMERNEEEWMVECSDDEKYESHGKNEWALKPGDVLTLIESLEVKNRVLELEWKCPGRRGPSPILSSNRQQDSGSQEYKTEEKSDFDFMDEMSSPRLPVRRIGESTPKGSAKKKTASFNGVLSTMLRHRRLEQQEINSNPKKIDSAVSKMQPS